MRASGTRLENHHNMQTVRMLPPPLSLRWTPSLFEWFWQTVVIIVDLEYAAKTNSQRPPITVTIRCTVDVRAYFMESFQSTVEKAVATMYHRQTHSPSMATNHRAQHPEEELSEELATTILHANEAFRGTYTTESHIDTECFTVHHFPVEQILEKGKERIVYQVRIFVDPYHKYSFIRPQA